MAIIEPSTSYTKGTLALAVLCFFVYLFFIAFAFYAVISNFKYLLKSEESLQPHRMKFYRNLFDDFNSKNKLQLLFVPLSMLRNLSYAMTLALLNSSPLTQIIIIWSVTAIFILYYIVKQPLKDKWTRRITLVSELFCFGCMTIGLIVGIIEKTVEIDPTTRNEIGFAFIAFAIISTLAGGLLTLIQVLELLVAFYKSLRDKLKRRKQVKPISLAELEAQTPKTPEMLLTKKISTTPERVDITHSLSRDNFERMNSSIKFFGSHSAQKIAQTPRGLKVIESIEAWCQEHRPAIDNTRIETLHILADDKSKRIEVTKNSNSIEN